MFQENLLFFVRICLRWPICQNTILPKNLFLKYFTFWWAFERNETRSNPLSQLWQIDPQSAINLKPDNFFQQRISFLPNVRRPSMLLCVACVVSAFTVFWFSLTAVVGQLVSTGRGSSMKIHPQETVIKIFFRWKIVSMIVFRKQRRIWVTQLFQV